MLYIVFTNRNAHLGPDHAWDEFHQCTSAREAYETGLHIRIQGFAFKVEKRRAPAQRMTG